MVQATPSILSFRSDGSSENLQNISLDQPASIADRAKMRSRETAQTVSSEPKSSISLSKPRKRKHQEIDIIEIHSDSDDELSIRPARKSDSAKQPQTPKPSKKQQSKASRSSPVVLIPRRTVSATPIHRSDPLPVASSSSSQEKGHHDAASVAAYDLASSISKSSEVPASVSSDVSPEIATEAPEKKRKKKKSKVDNPELEQRNGKRQKAGKTSKSKNKTKDNQEFKSKEFIDDSGEELPHQSTSLHASLVQPIEVDNRNRNKPDHAESDNESVIAISRSRKGKDSRKSKKKEKPSSQSEDPPTKRAERERTPIREDAGKVKNKKRKVIESDKENESELDKSDDNKNARELNSKRIDSARNTKGKEPAKEPELPIAEDEEPNDGLFEPLNEAPSPPRPNISAKVNIILLRFYSY